MPSRRYRWPRLVSTAAAVAVLAVPVPFTLPAAGQAPRQDLQEQLLKEDLEKLTQDARKRGNARRGAVVFYQPAATCTKCHLEGEKASPLGPDVAKMGKETTDRYIVESILHPSKEIKEGYEMVTILTDRGKTITGLVVEDRKNVLVLRDPADVDKTLKVEKATIDDRAPSTLSLMPAGLVNTLANRQQFLDLARYLMEIAEGGPDRAAALKPHPSQYALKDDLQNLDHAGIIRSWGEKDFQRGKEIFAGLCVNCHGEDGKKASLPTARAFGAEELKFGADPYQMLLTLSRGNGLMGPMLHMTPKERYQTIYYVRETFIKPGGNGYLAIDDEYLDGLPKGTATGDFVPTADRDFGPALASQLETRVASALTVKLGTMTISYNLHTMDQAGLWSGGFLDLSATQHMRGRGEGVAMPEGVHLEGLAGWQWGHDGTLDYPKENLLPRGPLPAKWLDYHGHYLHGDNLVLSYQIDGREILELPQQEQGLAAVRHTLKIGPGKPLLLAAAVVSKPAQPFAGVIPSGSKKPVAKEGSARHSMAVSGNLVDGKLAGFTAAAVIGDAQRMTWTVEEDHKLVLHIPADTKSRLVEVFCYAGREELALQTFDGMTRLKRSKPLVDPEQLTRGGPLRWPEVLTTEGTLGPDDKAYAMDTLTRPESTPWNTWFRTSALDFFSDGRMALATHGGDIWILSGIDEGLKEIKWKRFAGGLYEPFGVCVVDDVLYVTCKDRLTRLHDFNHDGEADFYESFSADTDVSTYFHCFNFDLQTDSKGNFYFARCGIHTFHPPPGAVIKVSPDGKHREIYCTGFRAPNGIGITNDDRLSAGDNQGNWIPASKISLLRPGGFYGFSQASANKDKAPGDGGTDAEKVDPPETFDQPMIWMPQDFDNSCGGQLWVDDPRWGPLSGRMIHTSFGQGWLYYMMLQDVGDASQAAIIRLPYDFSTGVMRARVNPADGQVYTTGLDGWNGMGRKGLADGGVQRLRYTGKPLAMVTDCRVEKDGLRLSFNFALDAQSAGRQNAFAMQQWNYLWAPSYGSKEYSVETGEPGRDDVEIESVTVAADGKSVKLTIPGIQPVNQVFLRLNLKSRGGDDFQEEIYWTINRVPRD